MQTVNKIKLQNVLLFLLPIFAVIFIFREVIFFDKIFAHFDVLINYFPYFHALSTSPNIIQQSILSGFPIMVSVSTTWFSLLSHLVLSVFDPFTAFKLLDIAFIVGAYIFTYLYCRRIGLDHLGSILAGTIYIFSGQVMLWSETIIISIYYLLLPLTLYLLDIAFSRKGLQRYGLFIVAGIVCGLGWSAGHVQFCTYVHLFVLAFWLFKNFTNSDRQAHGFWLTSLIQLGLFYISSFIVGYPMIIALKDFLSLTERSAGVQLSQAWALSYLPLHIIHYLLPTFSIPYSPVPISQAFQNYIGILPFTIFLFGLFNFRRIANFRSESGFYFGMSIFFLLMSVKYSPIVYMLHFLPFLNTFRQAVRIMFIGDFAMAIYVVFTIQYLLANKETIKQSLRRFVKWYKRVFFYIFYPAILLFSIAYIFFLPTIENIANEYFLQKMYQSTTGGLPIEHYRSLIHSYLSISIGQFSITSYAVISLVIFSLASYILLKNIQVLQHRKFMMIAVLMVALNFMIIYGSYIHGFSRSEYLNPPNSAQSILADWKSDQPFRIFSPLNGLTLFNESVRCNFQDYGNWDIDHQNFLLRRELMETNMNMLYGIDSADGYEPYMPVRMSDLLAYYGSRFSVTDNFQVDVHNVTGDLDDKIKTFISRRNALRAANVAYVLSIPEIKNVDFKLISTMYVGGCESPVHIYRLTDPWPRYFMTNNYKNIVASSSADLFFQNVNQLNNTTEPVILIEGTSTGILFAKPMTSTVKPKIGSDTIDLESSLDEDSYFFIGNEWLPNWTAKIDGNAVSILRANYVYMAIFVPRGYHKIELKYQK